jgi:hypothetical protein
MKDHEELYTSCIKDKFEKPDLPDPGDTAHPVWQFFENIALDTAASNEDNVGSARCKDCLGLFSFPETDVEPLEEHLRSDHRPNLDSYEALCIGTIFNIGVVLGIFLKGMMKNVEWLFSGHATVTIQKPDINFRIYLCPFFKYMYSQILITGQIRLSKSRFSQRPNFDIRILLS